MQACNVPVPPPRARQAHLFRPATSQHHHLASRHACPHSCHFPELIHGGTCRTVCKSAECQQCHLAAWHVCFFTSCVPVPPPGSAGWCLHHACSCLPCPNAATWQWGTPVHSPAMFQHPHLVACTPVISPCHQMMALWACMLTPVMSEHQYVVNDADLPVHVSAEFRHSNMAAQACWCSHLPCSGDTMGGQEHTLCVSGISRHHPEAGQAHLSTC